MQQASKIEVVGETLLGVSSSIVASAVLAKNTQELFRHLNVFCGVNTQHGRINIGSYRSQP